MGLHLCQLEMVVRWRSVVRGVAEQPAELAQLGARDVVDVPAADVHRDGVAQLVVARRVTAAHAPRHVDQPAGQKDVSGSSEGPHLACYGHMPGATADQQSNATQASEPPAATLLVEAKWTVSETLTLRQASRLPARRTC